MRCPSASAAHVGLARLRPDTEQRPRTHMPSAQSPSAMRRHRIGRTGDCATVLQVRPRPSQESERAPGLRELCDSNLDPLRRATARTRVRIGSRDGRAAPPSRGACESRYLRLAKNVRRRSGLRVGGRRPCLVSMLSMSVWRVPPVCGRRPYAAQSPRGRFVPTNLLPPSLCPNAGVLFGTCLAGWLAGVPAIVQAYVECRAFSDCL
ncbi:hypothetical protein DAEQUDRAFT_30333 [Daedalea quercina L-15889]|uniref:Uncharacterized protein n=1 Tax=Daedalea quercina L-15889 TaxID=1314783 RepID=A0A165SPX2_9APHY|nr:hypothetical protein DAEQUDRAFT_30333 [Daedalea quercina L-15889]